jgi:hypothetical protein
MKNTIITLITIAFLAGCGQAGQKSKESEKSSDSKFSGAGTTEKPYEISTPAQLVKLAEYVNEGNTDYRGKNYKLTADLDLSAYGSGWNGGKGWIPIGINTSPFEGNFDGNNHKITGLFIADENLLFAGVFGDIRGGSVQNLGVEGSITAKKYVGGITGRMFNKSSISNCYSACTVTGNDYIGGLAGDIDGSISNCYSTGAVSGKSDIGGIAGRMDKTDSKITDCYTTGAVSGVSGNGYNVGGIAGNIVEGSVTNCHASGAVSGVDFLGGAVGSVGSAGSISNCYATGDVSGNNSIGGVLGEVRGNVNHCYATGMVSGNENVGGVAGEVRNSVSNCAALNQNVTRTSGSATTFGRISGDSFNAGTFSNNTAWDGMTILGKTVTSSAGASLNGESITKIQIAGDGTIGNRFTTTNGWATANGKLPGFGAAIDLPAHLQ